MTSASATDPLAVEVALAQLRRSVPGGIGTYARGLLQGLAALRSAGSQIEVVMHGGPGPRTGPDPLEELARSLGFELALSRVPNRLLTRAWDAGVLRAPGSAEVVHSVSLAAPAPRRGQALVVCVHDLAWREVPDAYRRRGRRWHEKALGRALRRAQGLVVPSTPVADALLEAGADEASVFVVGEGSDHLPPPDHAGAEALLARLAVHGPFFVSVSTLEPRKNLGRLVEAHRRALSELPDPWPLVVVGPQGWGPEPKWQEAARSGRVVLAGWVPDEVLSGLYRRARALVYVPLAEGFGLPPLEAMAAHLPVVASSVPSVGRAALEVDPLDVDSIAAGMVAVAADGAVREHLIKEGAARAAHATWAQAAARHVAAWQEVLERHRTRCVSR